MIYFENTQF